MQLGNNEAKAAETINRHMESYNAQIDVIAAANPKVYTPDVVQALKIKEAKTLWGGFFKAQAAAFAKNEVTVGDHYEPDSDGAARYLENPDIANLVPKELFSQDEWKKIYSEGKGQ